jgi:hypothetical protein
MTAYLTNKAQPGVQPKFIHDGDVAVGCVYTFGASGNPTLAVGDTFQLCTIPAGCTITGMTFDIDKIDSSGSPTIKLNIGDGGNASRFLSQSTIGQVGGYSPPNINGGMLFTYVVNTPLFITVQTAAAGAVPANANIRVIVNYSADP